MAEIQCEIASAEDREILVEMYLGLLQHLDQFDHEMLPTRANAEIMVDTVFLPAAEKGEPVMIAWDDGKPVGAIFWVIQSSPILQMRYIFGVGHGTYLLEEYRNKKLGGLLRNKATQILKEKGAQRLLTMPHLKNEISLKASARQGYIPFMRIDIFDL